MTQVVKLVMLDGTTKDEPFTESHPGALAYASEIPGAEFLWSGRRWIIGRMNEDLVTTIYEKRWDA